MRLAICEFLLSCAAMVPAKKQPKSGVKKADARLHALEQDLAKFRDLAARAQAELQNAKERLQREAGEMRTFAAAGVVQQLLPTVDNFQRAFAHLPAELRDHEWVKGVAAVEQDLVRRLADAGLKKIDCIGQMVDPSKHDVLQAGPGQRDVITEVFEDGYEFNGRVLRPAKVKVGNGE